MLYRVLLVSEMVGAAGQTTLSLAEIVGISERNNRRDEISSVMVLHQGEAAQLAEGARADLDRLLARLARDPRLRRLQVLEDRPVMQRRLRDAARLCALTPTAANEILGDRRLSDLSNEALERLLTGDHLKIAA